MKLNNRSIILMLALAATPLLASPAVSLSGVLVSSNSLTITHQGTYNPNNKITLGGLNLEWYQLGKSNLVATLPPGLPVGTYRLKVNGDQGVDLAIGGQGPQGIAGTNGLNGINGTNGVDGINGTNGVDGLNGTNGVDGINGTNGANGVSAYTYIGYASDTNGDSYSATPSSGLNYVAFLSTNLLYTPAAGDFTGLWQQYVGANGTNGNDGIDGTNGVSAYTYIGYASDANGDSYSATPSSGLNFVAFLSTNLLYTPAAGDFTGLWQQYVGANGTNGATGPQGIPGTNGVLVSNFVHGYAIGAQEVGVGSPIQFTNSAVQSPGEWSTNGTSIIIPTTGIYQISFMIAYDGIDFAYNSDGRTNNAPNQLGIDITDTPNAFNQGGVDQGYFQFWPNLPTALHGQIIESCTAGDSISIINQSSGAFSYGTYIPTNTPSATISILQIQ